MLNKQTINPTNDGKNTYNLYTACFNGYVEVAKLLIEKGADVNTTISNGFTPLYVACLNGDAELVKLLIEKGADVNPTKSDGLTPLYGACLKGHAELVKLLIEKGADVNVTTSNGFTPLYVACLNGDAELVKLLIEKGADVNPTKSDGLTPLYGACLEGHAELVKLLIEKRAEVNAAISNGLTPLCIACLKGHVEVAKLLIVAIVLENPVKEKPSFIENNETLSAYWDSYKTKTLLESLMENSPLHNKVFTSAKYEKNGMPNWIRDNFFVQKPTEKVVLDYDCREKILGYLPTEDLAALYKACPNHKSPNSINFFPTKNIKNTDDSKSQNKTAPSSYTP